MDGFRFVAHFIICGVLDRMFHQDVSRISHPKRISLSISRFVELARSDRHGGKPLNLEPYSVVQTARRA